jgi:D-amino-acid dehydrogenase
VSSVIVVGGGVIGAACAYYLRRAGRDVTVLERGTFGRGCSHGNCGLVSPSHVLPLAEPGALRRTIKAMLRPSSPFAIKPRWDPALWSWLFRFTCRCNQTDMLASAEAIRALLDSSRQLYDELMAAEQMDCEFQSRGVLFVFQHSAALDHHRHTIELLNDRFGQPTQFFTGDALAQLEPALKPGLAGGWLFPSDGHLRPNRLMAAWRQLLMARGVTIQEGVEVTGWRGHDKSAQTVVTSAGEFTAESFVVAAGAWTPILQRELGGRIPIQPGKGYSITMPRPTQCPIYPMIFEEHRVAVTPMTTGYRLGSTMEFAGYDATLNRRRLQLLIDGAQPYLHEPTAEPIQEEWFGWRPMTYDSKPIIGPSRNYGNVWIAAGHNMLGLSMSPATGKLISELVTGASPHVDPAPYAATRF